MLSRIIYGALLFAVTTYTILFTNEYIFLGLTVVIGVIILWEWLKISQLSSILLRLLLLPLPGIIAVVLLYKYASAPAPISSILTAPSSFLYTVTAFLVATFLWHTYAIIDICRYEKWRTAWASNKAVSAISAIFMITAFSFFAMQIYRISAESAFACFFIVCACDSGGYLCGRSFNGKKLCPNLSPNKTFGGLIGAMVLCIIAYCLLAMIFFTLPFNTLMILFLIPLTIIIQLGDLYESMLKRLSGVKDSGSIIPGHGGFFDRTDALLWSVPSFYLALLLCEYLY